MNSIYNSEDIEKRIQDVFNGMSEKRRVHTEGVMAEAKRLAAIYGTDEEKAWIAAKCHDFFRGKEIDNLNTLVKKYGLPDKYLDNANLAHGKLAAEFLKRELGITDREIIDAVSYHTTGRSGMSLLEKIVFIADAIEPGRDYPGVDEIRRIVDKDIDKACLMSLEGTIKHLKDAGVPDDAIDRDTIEAAEFLKSAEKEKLMTSKEMADLAVTTLDAKKGRDITLIDIAEKSSFADYLVLATGGSNRQVAALTDDVEEAFAKAGQFPKSIEGKNGTGWVLMDLGDIIVNIFDEDTRNKYSIEKVWGDCPITRFTEE